MKNFTEYLAALESAAIECALSATGGNIAGAARALGYQRTTLSEKMSRYGLSREDYVPVEAVAETSKLSGVPRGVKKLFGTNYHKAQIQTIIAAVDRCGGNRSEAAIDLGVSYRCVTSKLAEARKLGFVVPPPWQGTSNDGDENEA